MMMSVLDIPLVSRIRKNHALEHATMHVLTRRDPRLSLVGSSDWGGYTIYGSVKTETLISAAEEALQRLQRGERDLAVHPRCGTVIASGGVLAGLAAFVVMLNRKQRNWWDRLPEVMLATTAALIIAQPLGLILQEYVTTSPKVGDLTIKKITGQQVGSLVLHRVETEIT
jgi:hypothetical protein